MASKEMSEWIKFFTSAGVPAGAATTYAVTFIDNRIQKTMLLDITKEYLKEMGINVMGDIIAILKYCKTYHAQYEREKPAISAMQVAADGKVEVKRQTTAGSRMLEHYMRKQGVMDGPDTKVKVSAGMAARLGAVPAVGAKKNSVTMPQSVEVVPVKKVRRVTPEQEGKYIINMPEGSTPRTKKILEEQRIKAAADGQGRKTVFDRLGGGSKDDSTALKKIGSPDSVFSRLGGKKRVRSLSDTSDSSSICEYGGVLRTPPNSTGKITASIGKRTKVAVLSPTTSSVSQRLGAKVTPKKIQAPVSSTSSTSKMDQVNLKMSIKDRLGQQKPEVSSTSQISVPARAQIRKTNTVLKKTIISTDKSGVKGRLGNKESLGIKKGGGVVKRLGTQLKQTVTVRIPKEKDSLGQSVGMFARLGAQGTSAASPSIKERLGLQKAEASSTTPSITIMVNKKKASLQSAKLNMKKKSSLNITRTVSNSGGSSNVFSRLGTAE
ncbi:uncharacterized protein C19orf47-like [Anneissia japonica]|uniref:uncharacterized protein C19orf47-like n=1 Tax=Anneissia japonica TaxID=1529436 RepID=UPI0014255697|nr:uncharacterized protein C19orf47-like [Anneissia japonica]